MFFIYFNDDCIGSFDINSLNGSFGGLERSLESYLKRIEEYVISWRLFSLFDMEFNIWSYFYRFY